METSIIQGNSFEEALEVVRLNKGTKPTTFYIDTHGQWFEVEKIRVCDKESLVRKLWLIVDLKDKSGYGFSVPIKNDKFWNELVEHGQIQTFDKNGEIVDARCK